MSLAHSVTYSFGTPGELAAFVATVDKKPVGRPAGSTTTGGKGNSTTTTPKYTKAQAVAQLQLVRDKRDAPTAKAIIKSLGVEKMADIPDDLATKAYELATAALEDTPSTGDDLGDDL